MKKISIVIIFGLIAFYGFGQESEKPVVMYEIGSGYGIGINMGGAVPLEIKMIMPFSNFGFMLGGGVDFAENMGGHGFIGATYFIFDDGRMRLPLSLGFNISGDKRNFYPGIIGIASYHFEVTNNVYAGFNIEVNYNFNNRFTDIVGNGDGIETNGIDGSGNPITTFPSPKTDVTNHWGNYIRIKPTICIGYQFQ